MIAWAEIGLLLLRIANALIGLVHDKQQMDAGTDKALAAEAASILLKTKSAKEIMERVSAMSADEVDRALKDLEPK